MRSSLIKCNLSTSQFPLISGISIFTNQNQHSQVKVNGNIFNYEEQKINALIHGDVVNPRETCVGV